MTDVVSRARLWAVVRVYFTLDVSTEARTSQARTGDWVTTRYLTLDSTVEIGRKSRSWINCWCHVCLVATSLQEHTENLLIPPLLQHSLTHISQIWLSCSSCQYNGPWSKLWAIETCHFILDHNSRVSWWISTLCARIKTGKNTPSGNYKICNVTTTVSLQTTLPEKI